MPNFGKRKLRLSKFTLRKLTDPELKTVQGGDVIQLTRAFTDCEYCGGTQVPDGACQDTHQCTQQDRCTDFFVEGCLNARSWDREDPGCL